MKTNDGLHYRINADPCSGVTLILFRATVRTLLRGKASCQVETGVVGTGTAGVRTLEELLKIAPVMYDITVFGAEPHPNFN